MHTLAAVLGCTTLTPAQSYLARVLANDRAGPAARAARKLYVGGEVLGRVLEKPAEQFARFPSVFDVTEEAVVVRDDPAWAQDDLVAARSQAVAGVLSDLRAEEQIPELKGWRDEAFAVRASFYGAPSLLIERAAAPLFGATAYGVFLNGFVGDTAGTATHLWLGRRADDKPTWPGLLDCVVAGGLAAGQLPLEAMRQECAEEAGIDAALAATARPVGGVSYTGFSEGWGLKRDVLFSFDLQLPADFEPVAADGEMAGFRCTPIEEVCALVASSEPLFKPNVGVIIVDFLMRNGFVSPDDPGYLQLLGALRGADCS
jgi:8-oxo-dGTP pyrophosphatase MutT (NUDIX family)